jgi:FkbM family methyltransferase
MVSQTECFLLVNRWLERGVEAWRAYAGGLCPIQLVPPYVLVPGGRIAHRVAEIWGADCVGIADSDPQKHGVTVHGVVVESFESLALKFPEATFLICSAVFGFELEEKLRKLGVRKVISYPLLALRHPELFANREYDGMGEAVFQEGASDIIRELDSKLADEESRMVLWSKIAFYLTRDRRYILGIRSSGNRYFSNDVVTLAPKSERFVDVGAFDGDTLRTWTQFGPDDFDWYLAFEPDKVAYEKLCEQRGIDERVHCVPFGVSDTNAVASFLEFGLADSQIVTGSRGIDSIRQIQTVCLDDYFKDLGLPTQVKIDIEGGERSAIRGGEEVFSNASVKLSISAYHYPRDLWEIPSLLHELRPQSRIYLRHYTNEVDDTVCYIID